MNTVTKCAVMGLLISSGVLYFMRYLTVPQTPIDLKITSTEPVDLKITSTEPVDLKITSTEPENKGALVPENICDVESYSELCKGNLNIPRIHMPQIMGETKDNFLSSQSIRIFSSIMPAEKLTPIQNEMSYEKILKMVQATQEKKWNACKDPIMVTAGDVDPTTGELIHYVLDGHHRYAACTILGSEMSVIKIYETARNILHFTGSFPGITYEGL